MLFFVKNHIFKLPGMKTLDFIKISTHEKDYLLGFCDDEFIVGDSVGFIRDDKIYVRNYKLSLMMQLG